MLSTRFTFLQALVLVTFGFVGVSQGVPMQLGVDRALSPRSEGNSPGCCDRLFNTPTTSQGGTSTQGNSRAIELQDITRPPPPKTPMEDTTKATILSWKPDEEGHRDFQQLLNLRLVETLEPKKIILHTNDFSTNRIESLLREKSWSSGSLVNPYDQLFRNYAQFSNKMQTNIGLQGDKYYSTMLVGAMLMSLNKGAKVTIVDKKYVRTELWNFWISIAKARQLNLKRAVEDNSHLLDRELVCSSDPKKRVNDLLATADPKPVPPELDLSKINLKD